MSRCGGGMLWVETKPSCLRVQCDGVRVGSFVIAVSVAMVALSGLSRAADDMTFPKLVALAEQRQGFVAILAPSITKHCMRAAWGQLPPRVFRNWAETLLLDDLANRAKVQNGMMTRHEAVASRRALFLSLEMIEPEALKAIELYTSAKAGGQFGRDFTQVIDCQYKAMAVALVGNNKS